MKKILEKKSSGREKLFVIVEVKKNISSPFI